MGTLNGDGLYVKYGQEESKAVTGGEFNSYAGGHIYEVDIDLTKLTTTATGAIVLDSAPFSNKALIKAVEVLATTVATSGGAATLNVGLINVDRTTAYDSDGLVAALALTSINVAGESNTLTAGTTGAGALVGTITNQVSLVVAYAGTAVFTGGSVKVRIHFIN